jgi:hypothetical protein
MGEAENPMNWLQKRLVSYPRIIITLYVVAVLTLIISAILSPSGLIDYMNRPLGSDFSHYWVASSLSLAGDPGAVYNFPKFFEAMQAAFKVQVPYAWFYPPTFLLVVYPFAYLPYPAALGAWLGITLAGYLIILRRSAPYPRTIWLALAFPGTFENFIHGQNGFLSAILVGGGLLYVDRYPVLGGFLLGLVSYKPQFIPLIPLALLAGRRWRALLATGGGVLALAAASYLVFGKEVWVAFIHNMSLPMQLLEDRSIPVSKMVTIFTAAFSYGVGFRVAWLLQGIVSLAVAGLVAFLWHKETSLPLRASALVLGMLVVTPYAFPYDLALLALPLAWLGWEGYTSGWLPGETLLLAIGWISPIVVVMLNFVGLHITPLILLALLWLVLRRSQWEVPILNSARRDKHGFPIF